MPSCLMGSVAGEHFLTSTLPLRASDAVAALIVLDDGRYLMQKRDDFPAIWYPGHWGLFGGGVEPSPILATTAQLVRRLSSRSPAPIG